jgi:hypothetical protein
MAFCQLRQHECLGDSRCKSAREWARVRPNSLPQDAELASLEDSRDAFQLYDAAVM